MFFCAAHIGYKGTRATDADIQPPLEINPDDYPIEPPEPKALDEGLFLLEITDAQEFAKAVLESRDFREYVFYGIRKRDIPPTVLLRLMDYGWGKPAERVEHTGKDGEPIQVTEVRRVIIRSAPTPELPEVVEQDDPPPDSVH